MAWDLILGIDYLNWKKEATLRSTRELAYFYAFKNKKNTKQPNPEYVLGWSWANLIIWNSTIKRMVMDCLLIYLLLKNNKQHLNLANQKNRGTQDLLCKYIKTFQDETVSWWNKTGNAKRPNRRRCTACNNTPCRYIWFARQLIVPHRSCIRNGFGCRKNYEA